MSHTHSSEKDAGYEKVPSKKRFLFLRHPRTYVIGWALGSLYIWARMISVDINFLIIGLIFTPAVFLLTRVAQHLILENVSMNKTLRDSLVLWSWSLGLVTSFLYSALISGNWSPAYKIPSACFGVLWLHHFLTFTLCAIFLLFVGTKKVSEYPRYSRITLGIGGILITILITASFLIGWFPSSTGFWRLLIPITLFFFALSIVLRSYAISPRWFILFMTISTSVTIGVGLEGLRAAWNAEYLQSPLTFLNLERIPCH